MASIGVRSFSRTRSGSAGNLGSLTAKPCSASPRYHADHDHHSVSQATALTSHKSRFGHLNRSILIFIHTTAMDILTQKTPTALAIAQAVGITGSVFLVGKTLSHSMAISMVVNGNMFLVKRHD